MNKKNQKGFTLVELIVVIAIVAILASVAIVGYTQFINNARKSKAQAELDQIYNVMYADAVGQGIKLNASGETVTDDTFTVEISVDETSKLVIKGVETAVITALTARYLIGDEFVGASLSFGTSDSLRTLVYRNKDSKSDDNSINKVLGSGSSLTS